MHNHKCLFQQTQKIKNEIFLCPIGCLLGFVILHVRLKILEHSDTHAAVLLTHTLAQRTIMVLQDK